METEQQATNYVPADPVTVKVGDRLAHLHRTITGRTEINPSRTQVTVIKAEPKIVLLEGRFENYQWNRADLARDFAAVR